LALKPGTIVFVEGDVFVSENQENALECTVKKMFMIVEQQMERTAQYFTVEQSARD